MGFVGRKIVLSTITRSKRRQESHFIDITENMAGNGFPKGSVTGASVRELLTYSFIDKRF